MRLSLEQQSIVKEEVATIFGENSKVWLFGSRVDDEMRGGDIDLYIETDNLPEETLQSELKLHARLVKRLGDQKIDIVIYCIGSPIKPIHEQARKTGIEL